MTLAPLARNRFLVLGRAGMDLYAHPPGTRAEEADYFFACLGGSAANVAAGIAKLAAGTSLLTAVSDDAVGRSTVNALAKYGVDTSHIAVVGQERRTSLAVVETRLDDFQSVIYRNGAADLALSVAQAEAVSYDAYGALILAGTVLATEPSRSAAFAAIARARAAGIVVILDIDYRPYTWSSAEEAAAAYSMAAQQSDIVIGNEEELTVMGACDGKEADRAQALVDTTAAIVVLKRGADGALTFTKDEVIETGIYPVTALKPVGAGDAFMAGFVTGLARGRSVRDSVQRGSAAAAITVAGIGCAPAMPTSQELAAFMARHAERTHKRKDA